MRAIAITLSILILACPASWSRGMGGGGGHGGGGFGGGYGGYGGGRGYGGEYGRSDVAGYGGYGARGFGEARGSGAARAADQYYSATGERPDGYFNGHDQSYYSNSWAGKTTWSAAGGEGAARGVSALPGDHGLNEVASNGVARGIAPARQTDLGNAVRDAYSENRGLYGNNWYNNRYGWWNNGWGNDWAWGYGGWGDLAGWWGVPESSYPTQYDYGDNVYYSGDNVYYGSAPVATSDQYYTQAQTLAEYGQEKVTGESAKQLAKEKAAIANALPTSNGWKPLGMFSLVQNGQSATTVMFQLAADKSGHIKGNCLNVLSNETKPVSGAVDKKNMRAAWTVGTNKAVVYDTSVGNLLQEQSPILVHFDKAKTEQWMLVRLENKPSDTSKTVTQ